MSLVDPIIPRSFSVFLCNYNIIAVKTPADIETSMTLNCLFVFIESFIITCIDKRSNNINKYYFLIHFISFISFPQSGPIQELGTYN